MTAAAVKFSVFYGVITGLACLFLHLMGIKPNMVTFIIPGFFAAIAALSERPA